MDLLATKEMLIRDEGVRYKPYRCPAGKLSIGVGRNLEDVGINWAEANLMLEHDIARSIDSAKTILGDGVWLAMGEARQMAVVNMIYNIGPFGFVKFKKLITALRVRDYAAAAKEALDSRWARQVGKRAERIAHMLRTNELPD